MRPVLEPCWILGFDAEAVGAWKDARLAYAIDDLCGGAGCPASAQAWWMACSDQFSFRWYLSESLAEMLDQAKVDWREFALGKGDAVPPAARQYVVERNASSERKPERRAVRLGA